MKIREIIKDVVAPFEDREPSCENMYGARLDDATLAIKALLLREYKKSDGDFDCLIFRIFEDE